MISSRQTWSKLWIYCITLSKSTESSSLSARRLALHVPPLQFASHAALATTYPVQAVLRVGFNIIMHCHHTIEPRFRSHWLHNMHVIIVMSILLCVCVDTFQLHHMVLIFRCRGRYLSGSSCITCKIFDGSTWDLSNSVYIISLHCECSHHSKYSYPRCFIAWRRRHILPGMHVFQRLHKLQHWLLVCWFWWY